MAKSKPAATNGKPAAPLSPLDVLTLAEAAAYMRLPEDAVREEAEAGRLVGRHVRGEWRFSRLSVARWLQTPQPKDEVNRATESGSDAEDEGEQPRYVE